MDDSLTMSYVKRTQKDYSISFKLEVVSEVKQGRLTANQAKVKYGIQGDRTVVNWIKKYGNLDRELQVKFTMEKSPEQRLMG